MILNNINSFITDFFHDGALYDELSWLDQYMSVSVYSGLDMLLVLTGTVFWCVAYYCIIRNSIRKDFIEMPMMAAAANIAWEFVRGWIFPTDMGSVFAWGFKIWFFMDVFIFYHVFTKGHTQTKIAAVSKYWKPLFLFTTLCWGITLYFFGLDHQDTSIGATSAYVLTVAMSLLYILLFLSHDKYEDFSFTAAWTRMTGDLFMNFFVWMHYRHFAYVHVLAAIVLVLDVAYVLLFMMRIRQAKATTAAASHPRITYS